MTDAKSECEGLLNEMLPFAEETLRKHGEFYPYASAMTPQGEIVYISAYDGRERPPSLELIHFIKEGMKTSASRGDYKATALVYDVRVNLPNSVEKSDAIAVDLDHKDNYSVTVLLPYRIKNRELSLGEIFAQRGRSEIFA